ncbi:MAG: hypothetical protein AAGD25_06895 [Cyanobacteria bacterium P01_F01_bin.150]
MGRVNEQKMAIALEIIRSGAFNNDDHTIDGKSYSRVVVQATELIINDIIYEVPDLHIPKVRYESS